jgi:hypothetical protein
MGVSDDVVAAMIEVTTKVVERRRADEERQAIRAELASLKKMIEEKKAASGDGKSSGQVVQTADGPMDALASCAKRLGAVKLCEQTRGGDHRQWPFVQLPPLPQSLPTSHGLPSPFA